VPVRREMTRFLYQSNGVETWYLCTTAQLVSYERLRTYTMRRWVMTDIDRGFRHMLLLMLIKGARDESKG
jgi:hypothetical protein